MILLVRIYKRENIKRNDKTYYKYSINIPNRIIEESGLDETVEVRLKVSKGKIVIEKD